MGGIKSFFKNAGKAVSKAVNTVAQVATPVLSTVGMATGNPVLTVAGAALGSLNSSAAENRAIAAQNEQNAIAVAQRNADVQAANEAAKRTTDYNNAVIDWENKETQRKIDQSNREIWRDNEIARLTNDYRNDEISRENAWAKANDHLKRTQIDTYNRRGREASAREQKSILGSLQDTYSALDSREQQESLQASQQRIQRIRQGTRERSTLAVHAAESGVRGRSLSRDAIASAIWQAEDVGTIDTNLEFAREQLGRDRRGAQAGAQSALNQSVFYDAQYEMDTPLRPFEPLQPNKEFIPDAAPRPYQPEPIYGTIQTEVPQAPKVSTTDQIIRAAGAGLAGYYSTQKAAKYRPPTPMSPTTKAATTVAGTIGRTSTGGWS